MCLSNQRCCFFFFLSLSLLFFIWADEPYIGHLKAGECPQKPLCIVIKSIRVKGSLKKAVVFRRKLPMDTLLLIFSELFLYWMQISALMQVSHFYHYQGGGHLHLQICLFWSVQIHPHWFYVFARNFTCLRHLFRITSAHWFYDKTTSFKWRGKGIVMIIYQKNKRQTDGKCNT